MSSPNNINPIKRHNPSLYPQLQSPLDEYEHLHDQENYRENSNSQASNDENIAENGESTSWRRDSPNTRTPTKNRGTPNSHKRGPRSPGQNGTPQRSSKMRQTPLRGSSTFNDKENDHGSTNRPSSFSREKVNHRRSILKQRNGDSGRGPRQSVSFAKQKEVVMFATEETR